MTFEQCPLLLGALKNTMQCWPEGHDSALWTQSGDALSIPQDCGVNALLCDSAVMTSVGKFHGRFCGPALCI